MGSRTNLSATRRTIRTLRATERLGEVDAGAIQLAETTAAVLDDALAADTPAYAVAKLSAAHGAALRALLEYAEPAPALDTFDAFMAEISTPTQGHSTTQDAVRFR
jgi:hypothetical protein